MFSVNSKNLNIGCTARFGEIKREKIIVIATYGEKTTAHACSGKTQVPAHTRTFQLVSACRLGVQTFAQNHNSAKALRLLRNGNH